MIPNHTVIELSITNDLIGAGNPAIMSFSYRGNLTGAEALKAAVQQAAFFSRCSIATDCRVD